jgi:hypothetical protein
MHCFLFKFTLVLYSLLLSWKLLLFEFLLGILRTSLCYMSAPHVKTVPLLGVHKLLMLFAGTLTYSEPRTFSLIAFYNNLQLLLLLLLHVCMNIILSRRIRV